MGVLVAIDGDLRTLQEDSGAIFAEDGVVRTYDNEEDANAALANGAVLVDRSHWGRLRLSGSDRLKFLHGQSTAHFLGLQPGQGLDTVFVTAQARTLDLATCLVQESGVLVVASPSMRHALRERLDKHILYGDDVKVTDVTDRCCMFSLAGPDAAALLGRLGAAGLADGPQHAHAVFACAGAPVLAAAGAGLGDAFPGATLVADEAVAAELWARLLAEGAVPMGEEGWDEARVLAGRPAPGAELTEEHTPLEAGLGGAVSLDKGCYIGQETLAKVAKLDAVKQQLWGLELAVPASLGADISAGEGGARMGTITSAAGGLDGRPFALGYLRCRSRGAQVKLEGSDVWVAGSGRARVVRPPFLSHAPVAVGGAQAAPTAPADAAASAARDGDRAAEQQQEAAAKAARLKEMQERLAAWQAQQQASQ
ncbi:hypothetical protein WJX81_004517 [Elliptochloris bilobata]|uniref:GCVT N-terminal domain-containing protein n=1 Tax=Elliptochloris bilobata TaxID=381761 RepID=A0AAW1R276_9CHLO